MAHGDDERLADEEHDVTELDLLAVLVVSHRLEHDEQRVVVLLNLGPLMRVERVLDREIVQLELLGHLVQLGLGRFVQTDPDEGVVLGAGRREGVGIALGHDLTDAVVVESAVDDHAFIVTPT